MRIALVVEGLEQLGAGIGCGSGLDLRCCFNTACIVLVSNSNLHVCGGCMAHVGSWVVWVTGAHTHIPKLKQI